MKIKESQLRNIIREALEEYRGDDYAVLKPSYENSGVFSKDGDYSYIRPGKNIPRKHINILDPHGIGKRNVTASVGEHDHYRSPQYDFVENRGKGALISKLRDEFEESCKKHLQVDPFVPKAIGKIEWTKQELKTIQDIYHALNNLANLTKVEGNKKRGYIKESQLKEMIKEKLRGILNESHGTIYGTTSYNPGEKLDNLGDASTYMIDANGMQTIEDSLYRDYTITFKARGYYNSGDYYSPPEDGLQHVSLYDDEGLSQFIKRLQDVDPELGKTVLNNFQEWYEQALYDAENGYGKIVKWDWDNLGVDDQPDWGDDF